MFAASGQLSRFARGVFACSAMQDAHAENMGEILGPGERGEPIFEQRCREGMTVPRVTFDELKGLAERLGVPMAPAWPRP